MVLQLSIYVCDYIPSSEALVTADDSTTSNNFSHEAAVSTSSRFSNMLLQHLTALCMLSFSMMSSAAVDSPNCVPITFQ